MTKMKMNTRAEVTTAGARRLLPAGKAVDVDDPAEVQRLELNGLADRVAEAKPKRKRAPAKAAKKPGKKKTAKK